MRVLLLGGTSEASRLAALFAGRRDIDATLSFAGRTKAPIAPPIPYRTGGFGGIEGLAAYLKAQRVDVLVDATHPFAEQMSRHAALAAARANVPLIVLSRPPWAPEPDDRWINVDDMAGAAAALGPQAQRVLLTVGRLQLKAFEAAPHHFYLIRAIDPIEPKPNLPRHRVIAERGPFAVEAEERLLREEKIDVIVTKNSGAAATFAKIVAARRLALPVIMVARPSSASTPALNDPSDALAAILRHVKAPAPRGV
ncbi:cobalt-precorrin-6A reductase [Methylocapsa aurea]|uniref:cobalt-precorrin-6A reductase n=1 Tax=Methylocapsa aurea TaxID=663610 RepID=UPI0005628182|nr:cobalt-precorrin-6A reductase [Methylocapsa aurea]